MRLEMQNLSNLQNVFSFIVFWFPKSHLKLSLYNKHYSKYWLKLKKINLIKKKKLLEFLNIVFYSLNLENAS